MLKRLSTNDCTQQGLGPWAGFAVLATITAVTLLLPAPVAAQGLVQCAGTTGSCTANDATVSVDSTSTTDYCASPTDTFNLDVTMTMSPSGGSNKFDFALWAPIDPDGDPTDPTDQCWTNIIDPTETGASDLDGDTCGDLDGPTTVTTTKTYTLSCAYDDQPLNFLFTWTQNDAFVCPATLAGTGSKCFLDASAVVDVPRCGDGNTDTIHGEECDDGNNMDGDGCDSTCMLEPICGDGIIDPGEECDDGNNDDGDGCQGNCMLPICGDGIIDAGEGEECDDGNNDDGDGCCSRRNCLAAGSDGDGPITSPCLRSMQVRRRATIADGGGCQSSQLPRPPV